MAIQTHVSKTPKRQRIPFAGSPTLRGTSGTKDQRLVNVYVDVIKNPLTGGEKVWAIKRPGLANFSQPSGGAATGRGHYYWPGTDKIYSVFNNKIYSHTTDLGVTLAGSSGRCWFDETPSTFGQGQRLLVSDGTRLYSINTSDVVTTVDTGSDADFPSPNLGPVVYFDSYILFAKSNGELWNSEPDSATSYLSTSFRAAEMFGDNLEVFCRQKDQVILLGKFSAEFVFNNLTAGGSPFERHAQNALQIGIVTKNSFAQAGDLILFVSKSRNDEYSVWMIDGLSSVKKVSTPAIERLLQGEGTNMSSCTAFLIRSQGHQQYFLNLAGANRTVVYDVTTDFWTEAADSLGNKFNCISATEKDGTIYLQDATNGRIYTYSPTTYQDSGSNFTVTLQTIKHDGGTSLAKFSSGINIEGDLTTGNLGVYYSDDDYANFSTVRSIDMSRARRYLPRLGKYFQRAWKFTYADNFPLRLEAFEETFDTGNN